MPAVCAAAQEGFPWGLDPEAAKRSALYVLAAVGTVACVLTLKNIVRWARRGGARRVRWDTRLGARGLDGAERDFVEQLARRVGSQQPERVLASVNEFEEALEQSRMLPAGDPRAERLVDSIRRKLGWVQAGDTRIAANDALLEPNVAMELFGTGALAGYCARGSLLHRDPSHLVLILEESGDDVPWKKGDSLQVYFWRENDAGYIFQSEIFEVREHGGICHLLLTYPERLERKQKRMFMRARIEERIRFQLLPRGETGSRPGSTAVKWGGASLEGMTEDVSAGGFRFVSPHELQLGDFIQVSQFQAAGADILAQVVNVLGSAGDGATRYGAQYSGLTAKIRETITRRVFAAQRESLNRNPA